MRLLTVVLVAVALPAWAAPAAPAAPPPVAADAARDHYERGLAKYNLAEFDAAIVEFKQSYEISKAPRLLFNIAQAYRLKKDAESALYFYNTYLRAEPNPPNRGDVEARIDEMKHALDEQKRQPVTPPPPTAVTLKAAPAADASPPMIAADRRGSRRGPKIAGFTAAGVGVVVAAVGGGLLGLAASDAGTLHRVAQNNLPWTPADDALYREGDRSQTAGIALVSIGGALVVAGGITLLVATRR